MQSLEVTGMKEVEQLFRGVPDVVKAAKGEVFEIVGRELLADVQRRIGGSGRVSGVQEYRVGRGKGYVAVRAKAETELAGYAAGYVTNALENGHEQKPGRFVPGLGPDGKGRTLKRTRVSGKHMYYDSGKTQAEQLAQTAAGRIEKVILDAVRGG